MVSERMAYSEALERIKRVRPCLFVNAGFVLQLQVRPLSSTPLRPRFLTAMRMQLFGRMGHALRGQSAAHALVCGDMDAPRAELLALLAAGSTAQLPWHHRTRALPSCRPLAISHRNQLQPRCTAVASAGARCSTRPMCWRIARP